MRRRSARAVGRLDGSSIFQLAQSLMMDVTILFRGVL